MNVGLAADYDAENFSRKVAAISTETGSYAPAQ
jgi:hypothetical protein